MHIILSLIPLGSLTYWLDIFSHEFLLQYFIQILQLLFFNTLILSVMTFKYILIYNFLSVVAFLNDFIPRGSLGQTDYFNSSRFPQCFVPRGVDGRIDCFLFLVFPLGSFNSVWFTILIYFILFTDFYTTVRMYHVR